MSGAALALVLLSASLHAGWNGLVAGARDTYATTAVMLVTGAVALAPFAAATWDVKAAAIPWAAASAALELAYFGLLARAYATADLTTVYPVARGAAPVIALVASVVLFAAPVGAWQAIGVVGVGAGVVLVRGSGTRGSASGVTLALVIAACIAGYTLVDDHGVRHAGALPYFELVLTATALAYVPVVVAVSGVRVASVERSSGRRVGGARRGRSVVRAAVGWRSVLAGLGMTAAYVLVLLALERAEAAPVAALRETGVVMATAARAIAGRRRVPPARVVGAGVVVAGVAAIALG